MKMKPVLIMALAVAVVLLVVPTSLRAAVDAAAVYKSKCAMCHGANGMGDTATGKSMKVRDFHSADVQKQSDEQIEKIIENSKGKMPAYKSKLSDAEIDALVKYIRELAKKK